MSLTNEQLYELELNQARRRIETLEVSLRQIARMRLMPNDKINTITLHGAIEVAKLHFADSSSTKETKP